MTTPADAADNASTSSRVSVSSPLMYVGMAALVGLGYVSAMFFGEVCDSSRRHESHIRSAFRSLAYV